MTKAQVSSGGLEGGRNGAGRLETGNQEVILIINVIIVVVIIILIISVIIVVVIFIVVVIMMMMGRWTLDRSLMTTASRGF